MAKYNIEYSLMRKGEKELFTFYEEMLPTGKKVIKSFIWRSINKAQKGNETFLAKVNNKIIGTINNVPVKLCYKNLLINACWHTDAIVSSKHRGGGIGTELMFKSSSKYDLVLQKGISEDMYYLSTNSTVGFKDAPNVNYLFFDLQPFSIKKALIKKIIYGYYFLVKYYNLKYFIKSNLKTRKISYFYNACDKLIKIISKDELQIQKGSDYLNWRYFKCPLKKYSVIKAYDNNCLRGAIVTTINDQSHVDIVDLICDTNDRDCVQSLIKRLFQEIEFLSINFIFLFATSNNIRRIFQNIGFIKSNRSPRFTFWLKNQKLPISFDVIPWNFFSGDGDDEVYVK